MSFFGAGVKILNFKTVLCFVFWKNEYSFGYGKFVNIFVVTIIQSLLWNFNAVHYAIVVYVFELGFVLGPDFNALRFCLFCFLTAKRHALKSINH